MCQVYERRGDSNSNPNAKFVLNFTSTENPLCTRFRISHNVDSMWHYACRLQSQTEPQILPPLMYSSETIQQVGHSRAGRMNWQRAKKKLSSKKESSSAILGMQNAGRRNNLSDSSVDEFRSEKFSCDFVWQSTTFPFAVRNVYFNSEALLAQQRLAQEMDAMNAFKVFVDRFRSTTHKSESKIAQNLLMRNRFPFGP